MRSARTKSSKAPSLLPAARLPVGMREVLGFVASRLVELPSATTLVCFTVATDRTIVVTTSWPAFVAARARGVPRMVGSEWVAFVRSVEQDRVWPADVDRLIQGKLQYAEHRFFDRDLIGTVEPEHWTIERVLRRVGLELLDVRVGDELPAGLVSVANDGPDVGGDA